MLGWGNTALGQERDVCDTSSCLVGKAGRYKIELEKKCGDRLTFFIHAPKDMDLSTTEILGYVGFFYLDNNFYTEEIYRYGNTNRLEVAVPDAGFFNVKISLVIKRESVSAEFKNECILPIWDRYKAP